MTAMDTSSTSTNTDLINHTNIKKEQNNMSRGYIYHASIDPLDVEGIDETDFDDPDVLGCDYVANVVPDAAKELLGALAKRFSAAGFAVQTDKLPEGCAFALKAMPQNRLDKAKKAWFKADYDRFKELSATITPEEFSCGTDSVYAIQTALDDRYSDAVYLDMGTGPAFDRMSAFMRNLQPDKNYFFEDACVFMH